MLMSVPSKMSNQAMLQDTTAAIFSPESPGGLKPCEFPLGQQIDLFGPDRARVNRFRAPASISEKQTSATYGRLGIGSSRSADLQRSLESRLRRNLDANGSLEYELTWKRWDTHSGPPICALRASTPRRYAKDFFGYPTPRSSDRGPRNPETAKKKLTADGRSRHHRIEDLLTVLGTRTGYPNPMFLSWLMDFPESWVKYAPLVTRSTRKSRQSLSPQ
jgi:hypothetical protein